MFKEFDVVKATLDINQKIQVGTVGAIMACYDETNNFLVEFVDKDNESLGFFTVNSQQIELVKKDNN